MNVIRSLAEAANDEFNAVTDDELDSYCNQLNIQTRRNSTRDWKLSQVRASLEQGAKVGIVETTQKAPRDIRGKQLNLRAMGRWEGRRRMVILTAQEQDTKSSWRCISWDGNQILVHTDMEVSIPYPHYNILKDASREIYTVRNVPTAGGGIERQESIRYTQHVPYQDIGDDPATRHLPTSYIDRAQGEARAKNYYKNTDRKIMVRILSDLVDNAISREDLKEMGDEEIREQIMNKLGLYEEVQETDFALENVA